MTPRERGAHAVARAAVDPPAARGTALPPNAPAAPDARRIVGARVDVTSYADAVARVLRWARGGESRAVCAANVHVVMERHDDPSLRTLLDRADLITPDGMPLVWGLRLLGVRDASRVYGPDLTLAVLAAAERESISVAFYGGTPEVLGRLVAAVRRRHPRLHVAYAWSPPFRELSPSEDERVVRDLAASGARILLVGLGCPRQERWVLEHRGRVPAVMLAVGAAFDFLAGAKPQAPRWMMRLGLEWLFRLLTEPRRLWRRYAVHNPRFLALFARQLLAAGRLRGARGP